MRSSWWWLLAALAACASPQPVAPERAAAVQQQFLQPFLEGGEVGCGELWIEMTANFVVNVSQPAVDVQLHSARKEQHDGYRDTIWTNKVGDLTGAFVVTVGETDEFTSDGLQRGRHMRFLVLHQVRIRVLEGRQPMTLSVEARPAPLVQSRGGEVRDLRQFHVENGVLRTL